MTLDIISFFKIKVFGTTATKVSKLHGSHLNYINSFTPSTVSSQNQVTHHLINQVAGNLSWNSMARTVKIIRRGQPGGLRASTQWLALWLHVIANGQQWPSRSPCHHHMVVWLMYGLLHYITSFGLNLSNREAELGIETVRVATAIPTWRILGQLSK